MVYTFFNFIFKNSKLFVDSFIEYRESKGKINEYKANHSVKYKKEISLFELLIILGAQVAYKYLQSVGI